MPRQLVDLVEFLLLGTGSGVVAAFILRTELPLPVLLCAGLAGVTLEPLIHETYGPVLFDHSLLASIAVTIAIVLAVRLILAFCHTWYYQHR